MNKLKIRTLPSDAGFSLAVLKTLAGFPRPR